MECAHLGIGGIGTKAVFFIVGCQSISCLSHQRLNMVEVLVLNCGEHVITINEAPWARVHCLVVCVYVAKGWSHNLRYF